VPARAAPSRCPRAPAGPRRRPQPQRPSRWLRARGAGSRDYDSGPAPRFRFSSHPRKYADLVTSAPEVRRGCATSAHLAPPLGHIARSTARMRRQITRVRVHVACTSVESMMTGKLSSLVLAAAFSSSAIAAPATATTAPEAKVVMPKVDPEAIAALVK